MLMRNILNQCNVTCLIIFLLIWAPIGLIVPNYARAQSDVSAEDISHKAASNQDGNRPKPIPRARWSEDWSTFGNVTPLLYPEVTSTNNFWDPIKYIPLNESGESYLSFGGEARLAYEVYDDKDMGISDVGDQNTLQLRLASHMDWRLDRHWRIFGQLGYGRVDNREGGKKSADETDVDIWEMFIGYRFLFEGNERVVIRLGRQLIETANLFINVGEGNNVRQHYDGLRVGWIDDDFIKLDVFAAEYVDFEDGYFDMSGTDEYFWGFTAGMRHQQIDLDFYFSYLGWDLKDRQFEQGGGGRHDEERHTLLFRIHRPLNLERQLLRPVDKQSHWGFDYYLAYQFGEFEDQPGDSDIDAYAAFGEVRYAFYPKRNTPIAGLRTAYFSGDSDPDDDELNTFYDHVFATPFFGYARDIQPFNLIFIQPNLSYSFSEKAMITLSHGFHWRADTDDAFYGGPSNITASAGTSDSSWVGQQTQISIRYLATPNLLITSYLARFFVGDMLEDAGGSDRDYFHIGIHYLF